MTAYVKGLKQLMAKKLTHNFRTRDFCIQFSYKYCHQPFFYMFMSMHVLAAYWLGPLAK